MSNLNEEIKRLARDYPGSTAELARRSDIDRSTLYKIFNGQRQPTEEQLENLLAVLQVSPGEYSTLTALYRHGRDSAQQRALHGSVFGLLQELCRVQQVVEDVHRLPPAVLPFPEEESPLYLEEGPLQRQWVWAEICRYLESDDTRPVMLSALLPDLLRDLLLQAFACIQGPSKPVWQFSLFAGTGVPENDLRRNLDNLRQYLPFLFLDRMDYQGRLYYLPALPPLPGTLLTAFLLLPHTAFLTDPDGRGVFCVRDSRAVEWLRLQYSRQYRSATAPLFLEARTGAPPSPRRGVFCLGTQPPLRYFLPDVTEADPVPNGYFTEHGLVAFLHTGQLEVLDLPPVPPAGRLQMLRRLREACLRPNTILRLMDDSHLPLSAGLAVEVYPGLGIELRSAPRGHCRRALLREEQVADALYHDLETSRTSQLVLSQKSTLEFLDYCIDHGHTII